MADLQFFFGMTGDIPVVSHNKRRIAVERNNVIQNSIMILDSDGDNRYDQDDLEIVLGSRAGKFFLGE